MRAPGEILLVACYELGHQPLAVAWPAAFLERAGYAPAVVDLAVEALDPAAVARARLVAVSVPMHTALRLGVAALARIRAINSAAHVCFYGLYAALNADWLRAHGVDSVLAGEAEEALVALARALEAADDGGAPAAAPPLDAGRAIVRDRLRFPVPRRVGLPPLRRYAHLEHDGRREPAGYVEASRGCKHRCRHCPIPPVYDGRFFVVPVETVLADVRQQVAAGARHVTFGDPDFLNGPRHALAVARALHAEFPWLTFDVTAKVEHLLRHRALLPELAALGCAFVVTAAESLDDRVLAILDKGHTRADLVAALGALRAAGIAPRPTWIAFTPWTTLAGYRAWLDFLADEDLVDHVDPVQYTIRLLVPPGSLLLERPEMQAHLGPLVGDGFHHRWTNPDARVERLWEAVNDLVTAAIERGEDGARIFDGVRALAAAHAGADPPP
ncbi:MAG TPA: CUAEP/CCAEP-tail radical SAM protein, partial [Candidatus Tectomicrobia bacterium]|nr:CUAEP/CCAEP-tail radical SAM protein [Candidatus Tectomicrobia bacterium]